jgi:tight adherence protein B
MEPLALIAAVCILTAVSLVVFGLGRKDNAATAAMAERLESVQERQPEEEEGQQEGQEFLRIRSYSDLPGLSAILSQFRGSEKAAVELERAGIPLRVGEYYMIRWGLALAFFVAPLLFNRSAFGLLFAVILAVVGYMLPARHVAGKKKARFKKINAQLVELLGLVSNSLKSGYALMQSFEFAADQMQPPLATELKRMLRETGLGRSAEDAILDMGSRINSPDLDMVIMAINIQRSVGGNLGEILNNVSFTMRERERIRGEIRTLTAQQRMTGIVIGGLPIFVGGLFMLINPDYMTLLFTETAGRAMLVIAVALEGAGVLVMKRVLAIEV